MSFEKIFTHGNLVDVNVSMWSAEKKLTAEDLGINPEELSEAFSLGKKKLIPAEVIGELRYLENRARHILIQYSFSFAFGGARFVPKKRFPEFAAEMEKLIQKFDYRADELTRNYSGYRVTMRKEYVAAAHEAYKRVCALRKGYDKSEDQYVQDFIARIEEAYPDASEIRKKFNMEYTVFQVSLPDLSEACYEDIAEEGEKIKMMQSAYQKSLYKKANEFVDRIINELRAKARTILQQMSNNLKGDKRVSEASLSCVRNMIEEYEQMDFLGDSKFLSLLKSFKARCLDTLIAKDIRDNDKIKKNVLDELRLLLDAASDSAAIEELARRYREGIGL